MNYYPWVLETTFKRTNEPEKGLKHAGEITYHPGVTLMTLSGISSRIGKKILTSSIPNYTPCGYKDMACPYLKTEIKIAKIPLILAFSIGFYLMLYLISGKFNLLTAIVFGSFVIYEPFLFLTSRDLHLDYLQTTFIVLSVLFFYKAKNYKYIVLSGFSLGLAILTRFPSVFFIPGMLLLMQYSKTGLKKFFTLVSIAIITFVLLYPPMWKYPLNTIRFIVGGSSESTQSHNLGKLQENKIKEYTTGIVLYTREVLAHMSPIWTLSMLIAVISVFYLPIDRRTKKDIGTFALVFLIYFLLLNLSDKKFFRYTTPSIVGLTIPMSYIMSSVFTIIMKKIKTIQ
jgi:4-amino-4-deoxy-L-arabinose transferase-like glycosyltransferase